MTVIPHFIDPTCVPDVYAEKLSAVEYIGSGMLRFTFTSKLRGDDIVVLRVVMEEAAVLPAMARVNSKMAARHQPVKEREFH